MSHLKWKIRYFVSLISLSGLTACDSGLNVRQICKDSAQFCNDLNADGWCRAERKNVILGRYQESLTPTDEIRYQLMLDLESYSICVENASHIEHTKLKEKKTARVNGYITSLKELHRLSEATKLSNEPHLLYWHWSRNGDETAMSRFLALRDTGALQTPELQLKLATYYVKFDRDKTIDTLYYALELYDGSQPINTDILKTLSTLFIKEKKYKHAYVWGKIARQFGVSDIDLAPLKAVLENQSINIDQLNDLVDDYAEQISEGRFIPPLR